MSPTSAGSGACLLAHGGEGGPGLRELPHEVARRRARLVGLQMRVLLLFLHEVEEREADSFFLFFCNEGAEEVSGPRGFPAASAPRR